MFFNKTCYNFLIQGGLIMKKKKSKWLSMILQLLCGMAFGAIIGLTFATTYKGNLEFVDIILLLLAFIFAVFSQIIVHETGHLIFGLLTGYSFVSFRIGSYMWIKENNHILFKRFSLAGTGGQCLLAPPPYHDGNYPITLYNLGGSLLNIIASFICFILFLFLRDIPILSPFLFANIIVGIFFAFVNGIPLRIGGISNDGYNALNTNKDSLSKNAFWITLEINKLNSQGIRLKDMSDDLFPTLEASKVNNDLTTSLLVMNFQRAMDQLDFNKAKSILDFINDNHIPILGIHQNILINDQIYYLLISNNLTDIDSLYTKELKQFIKAMKKTPSIIRTQYAHELIYNKDEDKAKKHRDFFYQVIKTHPYQCDIDSEKELMDYAYQIYKQENI